MNNKRNLLIMIIAFSLILILGSSYAYLTYTKESSNNYVINVGTLEVTFVDSKTEFLNLTNMYPMTDDEGMSIDNELVFQVQNTGNVDSSYDISIEEISSNPEFKSVIKYIVNKDNEGYKEPKILDEDKYIETGGFLKPNGTADYRVKVWLSEKADNTYMNKEFKAKVVVKGNQGLNLDKSGANPPKLLSNMLPVYYDAKTDTDGVWKIADKNNQDKAYKWYDYDKFMWANSVTIKETNGTLNDDSSMTFDGVDDYLDLGHKGYDFKDKISVIARVKVKLKNEKQVFLGKESVALGLNGSGKFYFSLLINKEWSHLSSNITANQDEWYTVVGTYDGKSEKIYINGQLNLTMAATGNIDFCDIGILLGERRGGRDQQFANVTVSDAFVYTDALTDSEIKEYFSGEITDYPKDNLLIEKTEFNELDTRQKYLEASAGTEIPMDDITSMWVWIPRYKYTIFNGNNGTSNEQMINVEFENSTNSTGTVSCHDDIKTDDDSASSEICEDKTNGKIIDMKSTYTHPAFTFGDNNLTGLWFAKFEMSTDDSNCLTNKNTTSCNKDNLNILVKPNQDILASISVSKIFSNIRNMETYLNIHGFLQNKQATSYLDINGNLSGDIKDDNNNYDIHMLKNMEWGAVTYLALSQYGKYGNSLYQGNFKRIYNNSKAYKTGYSEQDGILYNNLVLTKGQGYAGAGASTTGTVYGIYDMSAGGWEICLSTSVLKNNDLNYEGTDWSVNNKPLDKYYDKYSYATTNIISRGKLGDATKEIAISNFLGWNNSSSRFPYLTDYWFIRGGRAEIFSGGIFAYSATPSLPYGGVNNQTSRPIIAVLD